MRRWAREPLLHFVIAGVALFAVSYLFGESSAPRPSDDRIELTADDLRQLAIAWVAQGRPAPTSDEMRHLVQAKIHEEILYREALALGLDKGDAIVRRRLAQKMNFLFEDVAALHEPTDAELQGWFDHHPEQFMRPARATFVHRYFSPDRRGSHAQDDATRAVQALAGQSADAPAATALADPFMFQDYYGDRSVDEVTRVFGPRFARALFDLPTGSWQGPIESGYGWHLVFIDSIRAAYLPAFDEIAPDVKTAWMEAERARVRERAFEEMRARYAVVLPQDFRPDDLALGALAQAPAVDGAAE